MDLSSSSSLDFTLDATSGLLAPRGSSFTYCRLPREALLAGLRRPRGALIVTPNLDHLRLLGRSAALRRAYRAADVVLNDSRFVDRLALTGRALTLPGSELAPLMLAGASTGSAAVVIGCDAAVQADLTARYPGVRFTFIEPSMGFIRRRSERRALVQAVLAAAPHMLFICTGAPQSELLAAQMKRAGVRADMLCCGSAFHFLAGTKARAPAWARALGGEWAWRFALEPRTRQRYLADAAFLAMRAPAFLALRLKGRARMGRYNLEV
jgi:N-acetylglucosaminyldiphosphoundecaprenol N-acetyl-beta-D-mannosaminyltransferase